MKKICLLFVIFILPSVLAVNINLKEKYQPLETLIIEISGNFIDNLKAQDILFYSNRTYVPMISSLAKIQDKYYLYALLPPKERNYTLIIKNAHYFELGNERYEDLKYNFSVSGNVSSFSVFPGFIITNKDFSIRVRANKEANIKADFLNSTQEIYLSPSKEKRLTFSISGIKNSSFNYLILKSEDTEYKVPVFVYKESFSNATYEIPKLKVSVSFINVTVLKDYRSDFSFFIINSGEKDIENISLTSTLGVNITPSKINNLTSGSLQEINLTIVSSEEGFKNGTLLILSENNKIEIPILITTLENKEDFQQIVNSTQQNRIQQNGLQQNSCSELGGKFCKEGEECLGTIQITYEGLCCIGECKKEESKSSKWIAIPILIILALIIFFVYKKVKSKKTSPKEILEKRTKEYEERFKPKEIKGQLSRT